MTTRRRLLGSSARVSALLAACGAWPVIARAQAAAAAPYPQAAFDARGHAEALRALGLAAPQASREVQIAGPDIAENGALVPVNFGTTLAGARRLLLLVEKNPAALSAVFELGDAIEPAFQTRLKLAQSSTVYAVAITADGRAFFAQKDIAVTLGGCGN